MQTGYTRKPQPWETGREECWILEERANHKAPPQREAGHAALNGPADLALPLKLGSERPMTVFVPLRVLVVDDDSLVRTTLSLILESAGHTVSTLESGFGLAVAFRDLRPDVVVLDLHMPGLGGRGALRTARELCADGVTPKVLLHSGRAVEELAEMTNDLGADGFLRKPASRDTILAALHDAAHAA